MTQEKLSHYTILEEIGRGEIQIVYRARDDKLNREVALKVLPKVVVQDPERRARFVAEAKAAAALEHPHIGVIHEIDDSAGVAFIAMELLRGQTLAARLLEGRIAVTEALELGIGIAAGLAHAHERGIVHRDLKPANVMLTDTGHPKIIDFGLAKLLDAEQSPFLREAGVEESPLVGTTREGYVAGTVCFMSPEQARGGKVDRRSDVFSFGLLLFSMLAGKAPFEGTSRIDTLHAILREPTPKLPLAPEARQLLQPIIDRCLAKQPDARYASMSEVLEELKKARVRWEASTMGLRGVKRFAAAVALLVAGAALAVLFTARDPAPTVTRGKPSLAILHFENLSGEAELDWLRTGLTELLVTDLSQSKEIEILSTDRLYQILEDMDRQNAGPLPARDIEELARRGDVETVLIGSFAKAGDAIRLSARLQHARSGEVLFTETAEAMGEANIFRLVDELTGKIKVDLDLELPGTGLDHDLRDVTTASHDAYREYAEGIRLHERFREEEAISHFQAAVELDPGFAMALAKLGVVQSNLGLIDQADANAARALEHIDRLSERERYYIEGWAYSRRPETLGRAIESYEKAVELYPDHGSARHNLGNLLFTVERYDEAIEQLQELRRRRMLFPGTYEQLAAAYKAIDDIPAARQVLTDFSARNPEDWTTLLALAQLDIETGDIDRGLQRLRRARTLGAGEFRAANVEWSAHILREEWDVAMTTAETMVRAAGPVEKFVGGRLMGTTLLYRGEVERVIDAIDRLPAPSGASAYGAQPWLYKARVLLEVGDYEQARAAALAVPSADERFGQARERAAIIAIASQHLGDMSAVEHWLRAYRGMGESLGPGDERMYEFVRGELALARGDYGQAIAHLNEAESLLPPRGVEGNHALVWYSLANAHREAGNTSEAYSWYERILDAREERMFEPIRYVRSFYRLARLHEQDGDEDEARALYRRFVDHWRGGDLDREEVRYARSKLR